MTVHSWDIIILLSAIGGHLGHNSPFSRNYTIEGPLAFRSIVISSLFGLQKAEPWPLSPVFLAGLVYNLGRLRPRLPQAFEPRVRDCSQSIAISSILEWSYHFHVKLKEFLESVALFSGVTFLHVPLTY